MLNFPEHLNPEGYSFQENNVLIFESENKNIKTRPNMTGFVLCDVSFSLKEEEFIDLVDFYNIDLNKGIDDFQADFEINGVYEKYSFVSDWSIGYPEGTNTYYSVSFILAKQPSFCDETTLQAMNCIYTAVEALKGNNQYFENTVPCPYEIYAAIDCIDIGLDSLCLVERS